MGGGIGRGGGARGPRGIGNAIGGGESKSATSLPPPASGAKGSSKGECSDPPDIKYFTERKIRFGASGKPRIVHTEEKNDGGKYANGNYRNIDSVPKTRPTIYQSILRDDLSIEARVQSTRNYYKPKNGGREGGHYSNGAPTPKETGFVIVMHRELDREGKIFRFQQNGIYSDHVHFDHDNSVGFERTNEQILLEKLQSKIYVYDANELIGLSDDQQKSKGREEHFFYEFAMNQKNDELESNMLKNNTVGKYENDFRKNLKCVFEKYTTDTNEQARGIFEDFVRGGVLTQSISKLVQEMQALQQEYGANCTNLKEYFKKVLKHENGRDFTDALVEQGADEEEDDAGVGTKVVHKIERFREDDALLITPGIGKHTQCAALVYAQTVFDACCKDFALNGEGNSVSLQNLGFSEQIPLRLACSHRHVFFPKRYNSENCKQTGSRTWTVGETYMFVAKERAYDAVVAAVTRPRLRRNFNSGGLGKQVKPYLYLPYYAHRVWNDYMRMRILKETNLSRLNLNKLVQDLRNRLYQGSLLRYVKFATLLRRHFEQFESAPLADLDHTYIPWVDFMYENNFFDTPKVGTDFWQSRKSDGTFRFMMNNTDRQKKVFMKPFFSFLMKAMNNQSIVNSRALCGEYFANTKEGRVGILTKKVEGAIKYNRIFPPTPAKESKSAGGGAAGWKKKTMKLHELAETLGLRL